MPEVRGLRDLLRPVSMSEIKAFLEGEAEEEEEEEGKGEEEEEGEEEETSEGGMRRGGKTKY